MPVKLSDKLSNNARTCALGVAAWIPPLITQQGASLMAAQKLSVLQPLWWIQNALRTTVAPYSYDLLLHWVWPQSLGKAEFRTAAPLPRSDERDVWNNAAFYHQWTWLIFNSSSNRVCKSMHELMHEKMHSMWTHEGPMLMKRCKVLTLYLADKDWLNHIGD